MEMPKKLIVVCLINFLVAALMGLNKERKFSKVLNL